MCIRDSSNTVAVGYQSLLSLGAAVSNTAVGYQSLKATTTGTNNTGLGFNVMLLNTTGTNCVAVGDSTLAAITTGALGHTAIGSGSLTACTSGNNNTALGYQSLGACTTGGPNIAIGYQAGNTITTTSNNIDIGNVGNVADSGVIRIGTVATQTKCFIAGISGVTTGGAAVAVLVDATGNLGTTSSIRERKSNIVAIDETVNQKIIEGLKPSKFNIDNSKYTSYGMIYDEVQGVEGADDLLVQDNDGKPYTLAYQHIPIMLLKEIQRMNNEMREMRSLIDKLMIK